MVYKTNVAAMRARLDEVRKLYPSADNDGVVPSLDKYVTDDFGNAVYPAGYVGGYKVFVKRYISVDFFGYTDSAHRIAYA